MLVDGRSLSYDPPYGVDNKAGLQFIWHCHTYRSADLDQLMDMAARQGTPTSDCDAISTELLPGQRQLRIRDDVSSLGMLFKV